MLLTKMPQWRKRLLIGLGLVIGLLMVVLPSRGDPQRGTRHEQIMERKLFAVQNVVEGIARGNFDQIKKESNDLQLLSREAGWNAIVTPTYLRMSEDFRATVEQLKHAAENENLDAVGLAYIKLSISCIDCHRYAKQEMPRIGAVPRDPAEG